MIGQLRPILGDDEKAIKSFLDFLEEQKDSVYANLRGLSTDELDSLIHPSNLKSHPWLNFKKSRGGCHFFFLMYGLALSVSWWITLTQMPEGNIDQQLLFGIFGCMAVPIASFPLLLFMRIMQGKSAQKQLESVYLCPAAKHKNRYFDQFLALIETLFQEAVAADAVKSIKVVWPDGLSSLRAVEPEADKIRNKGA